ncbi:MAG: hypothetical protein HC808_16745 [Candidatus Competibacteraceae bacterium]|nr:hypothetical protein [Candidatus Competibacteraceae bacterium]
MFDPQRLLGSLLQSQMSSPARTLTRMASGSGMTSGKLGALALLGGVAAGAYEHFSQQRQSMPGGGAPQPPPHSSGTPGLPPPPPVAGGAQVLPPPPPQTTSLPAAPRPVLSSLPRHPRRPVPITMKRLHC